jgi:hypothetical protein
MNMKLLDQTKKKVRIRRSQAAEDAMVAHGIGRGSARWLLGRVFIAHYCYSSDTLGRVVCIDDGWWIPEAAYTPFVSRAAALAQAKRISPHKVKSARKKYATKKTKN